MLTAQVTRVLSTITTQPISPTIKKAIGRLHSKKGGSAIAIGGHVTFVIRDLFRKMANNPGDGPGGKNWLWWSPFSANGH